MACGCNNRHSAVQSANINNRSPWCDSCGCNRGSVGGVNTGNSNSCGCGNGSVGGANTGNSCGCNRNRRPCGLINGVSCGVTQAAFGIARGVDTILDSIFCCGGR